MDALNHRAGGKCELCEAATDLREVGVGGGAEDAAVLLCGACGPAAVGSEPLSGAHWFCLQEAIWSEVPAVQVLAFRLLHRLPGQTWAVDLLEQVYLDDAVRAWAERGRQADDSVVVVDSNGTPLSEGDTVTLIKTLTVKGAGFTAKRGTTVKNIRLGSDPTHIEGRVNKMSIMLKTAFLKKL